MPSSQSMFEPINIKQVLQDVKAIYPELRDFPQSRMIGQFGIETAEGNGVNIYDSNGQQLLTLWFDEEGNIVGYDDYVNQQCVAGSPEENFYCDPESEYCWMMDDFGQTQSYAMYFYEDPEPQPPSPPPPPQEPKTQQVQRQVEQPPTFENQSETVRSRESFSDTCVVCSATMDDSVPSSLILSASESFGGEPYIVPMAPVHMTYSSEAGGVPSQASDSQAAKASVVSAAQTTETAESDIHFADTAGQSSAVFTAQVMEDAQADQNLIEYSDSSESTTHYPISSLGQSQLLSDASAQMVFAESEIALIAQLENRTARDASTDEVSASSAANVEEEPVTAETRTNSHSSEVTEGSVSDIPEPVFVGWPVVNARMDISTAQISAKGSDDQSSKTVATVTDDNDASRHQGDPNENHGGQGKDEQGENSEDE